MHPPISGFNLIEAAIVLGVVGLVIGGIWIAAATVIEKKRIDDTLRGVTKIVAAVNGHTQLLQSNKTASGTDITSLTAEAGWSPADWTYDSTAGALISPIGAVTVSLPSSAIGTYDYFISFGDTVSALSERDCQLLVPRLKGFITANSSRVFMAQAMVPLLNWYRTTTGFASSAPLAGVSCAPSAVGYQVITLFMKF